MKVLVLHNTGDGMLWEYHPDKAVLSHAHTFDIPEALLGVGDPWGFADIVYVLSNEGVDYIANQERLTEQQIGELRDQVTFYRERRNRSTSSGDVVVLMNGEAPAAILACAHRGWKAVELDLSTIDLSDVDNRGTWSKAYAAHQAIDRKNPPNPFIGPV